MFRSQHFNPLLLQASVMASVFLMSCGISPNPVPAASCQARTAEIAVYDGGMQRMCGCAEGMSGVFTSGQGLVCTISAGTTVFFRYPGIAQSHQVSIIGQISFQPRSGGSGVTQSDAWLFNSSGSFTFSDSFTSIGGTIIVL
jgi:hypothetical protein